MGLVELKFKVSDHILSRFYISLVLCRSTPPPALGTVFFSLSLSQKYLPLDWRTHLIKPILKSGDKSSVRNYTPISLLSVVSKVLEKLVYNSIMDFVTNSMSVSSLDFYKVVPLCSSCWFSLTLF